jgi:hypothetical protein
MEQACAAIYHAQFVQDSNDSSASIVHMGTCALFAWLISNQPAVLFSQNKSATSNQPTVLFSQNKPAPVVSHQPNEMALGQSGVGVKN